MYIVIETGYKVERGGRWRTLTEDVKVVGAAMTVDSTDKIPQPTKIPIPVCILDLNGEETKRDPAHYGARFKNQDDTTITTRRNNNVFWVAGEELSPNYRVRLHKTTVQCPAPLANFPKNIK